MKIKEWFLNKMKAEVRVYGYEIMNYRVIDETEKAYKLEVNCSRIDGEKDMVKIMFCPKSCVMTEEEEKAEEHKFENACDRYNRVLEFAKANGLKVRKMMKLATMMDMIKNAGLKVEL